MSGAKAAEGACKRSDVLDATAGLAMQAIAFPNEPQFVWDARARVVLSPLCYGVWIEPVPYAVSLREVLGVRRSDDRSRVCRRPA